MSNFNEELTAITGGRSQVRTPQFMGQQKGFSIEAIRTLIKKQKRAKGFVWSISSGTSDFNLDLSGTARILLGFSLLMDDEDVTTQPENMNFIINNEIVIDQVPPAFFSPDFMDDEYYYFPRPLSGTDELKMSFQNSQAVQSMRVIIYYI